MKTRGRKGSDNIDDARAYFGSNSIRPGNRDENAKRNNEAHRQQSLNAAKNFKGTQDWNTFMKGSKK